MQPCDATKGKSNNEAQATREEEEEEKEGPKDRARKAGKGAKVV